MTFACITPTEVWLFGDESIELWMGEEGTLRPGLPFGAAAQEIPRSQRSCEPSAPPKPVKPHWSQSISEAQQPAAIHPVSGSGRCLSRRWQR